MDEKTQKVEKDAADRAAKAKAVADASSKSDDPAAQL